jgi:type I restriction enzyme S subunit
MAAETVLSRQYAAYPEYKDSGVEWFDHIPSHWGAKPLKFMCTYNDEVLADSVSDEHEIEYVDIGSVSSIEGITRTESMFFGKAPSRARRIVRDGDVIISTVRTYLEAISPVDNPPENLVVSTGFAVIRPNKLLHNGYAAYCLRASGFIKEVVARSVGISYPAINATDLVNIKAPEPAFEEQQKIASFLGHETAKIDTLITKQQALITLLKEKRQAVISHAVTKGLNPNAPMRDSGVEWLGEVPAHWDVSKFKFLCDRIIAGPFGSSITKDMYVKHGFKVYGQEQVIPNSFEIGDYYINEKDYLNLARYVVNVGDILISCVGTFGKIAVFPEGSEPGIINPRLIKAEVNPAHNPYYIRELLKSEMVFKQFELLSRGGTMGVINIAILSEILAAVPPDVEQVEIIQYINQQKEKFRNLIELANTAVLFLQERRTALISAAVTGKIDVRNWKAA